MYVLPFSFFCLMMEILKDTACRCASQKQRRLESTGTCSCLHHFPITFLVVQLQQWMIDDRVNHSLSPRTITTH